MGRSAPADTQSSLSPEGDEKKKTMICRLPFPGVNAWAREKALVQTSSVKQRGWSRWGWDG